MFNVDLCLALGSRIGDAVTVACVVPFATPEQIDAALLDSLHLVRLGESTPAADDFDESRADEVIRVLREQLKLDPQWWINHDLHTGPVAVRCRDICSGSRCAIVHHMDHSAYTGVGAGDTEALELVA